MGYRALALGTMSDGAGTLPLVVHLHVFTLISVMTFSCRLHSYNDDDDLIYIDR